SEPRERWRRAVRELGIEAPEKLLWPVEGGSFGRGLGDRHEGVDIGAEDGAPIRSVADGLVAYADNGVRGYGNLLIVIHGGAHVSVYAHCSAVYVFPGQRVRAGQHVADLGETGLARGEHLHFEWRRWGRVTDPLPRFGRWWE
ncbi:MAG: murein hydrolase activator EnvC family protein, partial [Polyangiales bacterium]